MGFAGAGYRSTIGGSGLASLKLRYQGPSTLYPAWRSRAGTPTGPVR